MLDESATSVDPKGLGRVLIVVSIIFLILTAIVVILRCVVRLKYRLFGTDDGLMLIGWVSPCYSETRQDTVLTQSDPTRCIHCCWSACHLRRRGNKR